MSVSVGVFLITYNHEAYIAQAIESVLSQVTDFDYRLVIGEDHSTDGTRSICEAYAAKFPDKIDLLPSDKNYGAPINAMRTFEACRKYKYTAVCEGDDYWIDPYKLQKQVDFLEAHPDFSMCFTKADVLNDMMVAQPNIFAPLTKDIFTIDDFIGVGNYFIPTPTILFRNYLTFPDFFLNALSGDVALHLLLAGQGKIKFLPYVSAVYRHHAGGVSKSAEFMEKVEDNLYYLYEQVDKYFKYKYHSIFRDHLLAGIKTKLIYGSKDLKGMKKLKHVIKISKQYFFYSDKINFKEVMYYSAILFFPIILKIKKANKQ